MVSLSTTPTLLRALLVLTFERLLGVEIVRHALDLFIKAGDLAQDSREVLQHQASRGIRVFSRKLREIVPDAASDVDEEDRI